MPTELVVRQLLTLPGGAEGPTQIQQINASPYQQMRLIAQCSPPDGSGGGGAYVEVSGQIGEGSGGRLDSFQLQPGNHYTAVYDVPCVEMLISAHALPDGDSVVEIWVYGFRQGQGVPPETLGRVV